MEIKAKKFFLQNTYFDGYAKLCGWKATLVYFGLCRYANQDGYCYPGVSLLSEKLDISRDTVMDGIQTLEEFHMITVDKSGRGNAYTLLETEKWVIAAKPQYGEKVNPVANSNQSQQVANSNMVAIGDVISRPQQLEQVANSDPNKIIINKEIVKVVNGLVANSNVSISNISNSQVANSNQSQQVANSDQSLKAEKKSEQEQMKDFLKSFKNKDEKYTACVEKLVKSFRLPKEEIEAQLKQFILHWIEPSSDGKKSRWEVESTFMVGHRISSWLVKYQRQNPRK